MGDYAKLKSVYVYLYEFDKNIWKAHNSLLVLI